MFYACGCLGSEAIQEKSSRIQVTSQCNASLHDWAATHELKFILMRRAKVSMYVRMYVFMYVCSKTLCLWGVLNSNIHTYIHNSTDQKPSQAEGFWTVALQPSGVYVCSKSLCLWGFFDWWTKTRMFLTIGAQKSRILPGPKSVSKPLFP